MSTARPTTLRWTREEYCRLAELGIFGQQRVELVEGAIIRMPAQKNLHAISIDLTQDALRAAFGPGFWIRIQMPLHLGPRSAPEPDLAVVLGRSRDYLKTDHPQTALLIVEISDTSLLYDRFRKASLYARAGIADYWIVNLVERRLEVRRSPVADPAMRYGFGYSDVGVLIESDFVSPLAMPNARIAVRDLLP